MSIKPIKDTTTKNAGLILNPYRYIELSPDSPFSRFEFELAPTKETYNNPEQLVICIRFEYKGHVGRTIAAISRSIIDDTDINIEELFRDNILDFIKENPPPPPTAAREKQKKDSSC